MASCCSCTQSCPCVDSRLDSIRTSLEEIRCELARFNDCGRCVATLKQLIPIQDKLAEIDSRRKDNAWWIDNEVPKGQAYLSELLNDCYDDLQQLKEKAVN